MVGLAVLFLRVNDPNAWLLASLFCGFVATPSFSHPLLMNPACARLLSGITRSFPECFARFSTSFCGISRVLSTASLAFGVALVLPGLGIGDMRIPGVAEQLVGERAAEMLRTLLVMGVTASLGWVSSRWEETHLVVLPLPRCAANRG